METLFFVIVIAILIVGFSLVWQRLKPQKAEKEDDKSSLLVQNQLNELNRTVRETIEKITRELTKVGEGQKQVISVADQLKNLQDILRNPKQRGILGEYSLEVLLQNFFPHSYERQYKFKDGTIVDFIIRIRDRIIPIDSKFSLENYQRILETRDEKERTKLEEVFKNDLRMRIDETAKYVKPAERTMDFAFMFIPAEAVYYDLLINKIGGLKSNTRDLIEYAMGEKKVVIVSPTSFLAYLQTVLQGLKAMQIEESAKEIRKRVEELGRHLGSYETYMQKLGTHLGTTVNMYNSAYRELGKIDKDVLRITGESVGTEPRTLERPRGEEFEEE